MRKLVVIIYLLLFTVVFSVTPKAYSYYTAAMSAMQMKDCGAALQWFEKALLEDPTIEDVDPYIKLWMGVCAYEIKNYAKARDFLKLFPDNEIAKSILSRMKKGLSPEEKEWEEIKELISQEKLSLESFTIGSTPPTSTATNTSAGEGKSSFLVFTGLFIVIFSALMILELKFGLIAGMMAKIPRIRIVVGNAEVVREVVHGTTEKPEAEQEEEVEEKEVEVDIEELFNAPLDTVDKLIYGEDFAPEIQEEKVKEEIQKETEEKAEEGKSEMEVVTQKLGNVGSLDEEEESEFLEEPSDRESEEDLVTEEEYPQEEVKEQSEEIKEESEEEPKEEEIEEKSAEKVTHSENLTDEDVDEVEKRAREILAEGEEEEEEGVPIELAGMDAEDILNELEEKDEYDEEDADKLLFAIQKLVRGEEEENEEGEG